MLRGQGLVSRRFGFGRIPIAPTPLQHQSLAPQPHPPCRLRRWPPSTLWNIGPVTTGPMFHRVWRNLAKPPEVLKLLGR
jgi:hypothetical protein